MTKVRSGTRPGIESLHFFWHFLISSDSNTYSGTFQPLSFHAAQWHQTILMTQKFVKIIGRLYNPTEPFAILLTKNASSVRSCSSKTPCMVKCLVGLIKSFPLPKYLFSLSACEEDTALLFLFRLHQFWSPIPTAETEWFFFRTHKQRRCLKINSTTDPWDKQTKKNKEVKSNCLSNGGLRVWWNDLRLELSMIKRAALCNSVMGKGMDINNFPLRKWSRI